MTRIDEIKARLAKATGGEWKYRPHEFDDWGFIRVETGDAERPGPIIAQARAGQYLGAQEEQRHREAGTDPFGPNALLIAHAGGTDGDLAYLIRVAEAAQKLAGAMKFVLAFYEPGQRYLDTNAWKNAEASARFNLAAYQRAVNGESDE